MNTLLLKNIVSKTKSRFRNLSIKPAALTVTLIVAGLLLSNSAFARKYKVNSFTVGQQGTATYGTAATIAAGTEVPFQLTFDETQTSATGTSNLNKFTIVWAGGITPAGVTTSIVATGNSYTPSGDNQTVNFNVFTTTATQPGTYTFTISTTETNGGTTPQTSTGTFIVGPKPLTVGGATSTLDAANKPYDGTTTATLTGTGALSGVINGDNVTLTGTPTGVFTTSAVGTNKNVTVSGYTLGGTAATKYTLTQPTVQANITVAGPITITATDVSKVYGQTLNNANNVTTGFTYTGTVNSETIGRVNFAYGTGAAANAAVGNYNNTVTISGVGGGTFTASNYSAINYVKSDINVTPAALSITANDVSKTYGTPETSGPGKTTPATFAVTGLQNGQTITVTLTYGTGGAATDAVGSYPNAITPSAATGTGFAATNYTITYNQGDITVTHATLTVKADNLNKAYGAAVPTLTYTATGFVNGETFTTVPTLTTTATASSNAGGYPITFATQGVVSSNYTATYTAGTLTVGTEPSTYDWTGAVSTAWNTAGNWNVNGIPQTSLYPGSTTNDDALIGVNEAIVNQPTVTTNLPNSLHSLTFGNVSVAPILTVSTGLAFNPGDFTVNANTTATLVDNGIVTVNGNYSNNATATLNINGSKSFTVSGGFTNLTNAGTLNQSGAGTVSFSNTIVGNITNSGTINQLGTGAFTMNITAFFGTISNSGTINQSGNASFSATVASINGTIANSGTISQSSVSGTMTFGAPYSNSTTGSKLTQTGTGTLAFNSTFTNKGTTTFGPGKVTMGDDFTNTSGTTAFGTGPASIAGDFTNNATVTSSTGTILFGSSQFTNSGPLTFGTGLVTFNYGASVTKFDANTNITLVNVAFTGGKNVQLPHSGNIYLASTGVLTMSNSTQLSQAGGSFTLLSDASGSATIAAIPAGCSITGLVNVQRFMSGNNDINKRGYRLISSPIHNNTTGANVFDLQYLTNSVYVSGPGYAANGFNVTTTANPSIYMFREDVSPPPSSTTVFTTGYNWKGVAQITDVTTFKVGTQNKLDPNNVLDTLTTIPVGNGLLFFFRGDKTPTVLTAPFSAPKDVTLMQTGTLNTGPVTVTLWFANAANGLGNNLSWTDPTSNPAYGTSTDPLLKNGFALVGNPYPSTINWEKYNNTNAPNAITGSNNLSPFIYEYNVDSKQFGVYEPTTNGTDFTTENPSGAVSLNGATNLIASGQGFFVQAGGPGQTLSFNETAKVSSQSSPAVMLNLMGKPVATAIAPKPTLHLKLVTDSLNNDEIVIRLSSTASAKYVVGEDAPDVDGSSALETLSSYSSDSSRLAINTMPFPGVKPEIIQIMAKAVSSGPYTLTVPKLNNMPALYQVWLKDAFTADSVQLKENTSYPFTIDKTNAATFGNTRFTVVIRQDTALAYKLLDFTASKTNHQSDVQLVWKTTNEGNYTKFTVERSTDNGKTFTVVGGMPGTGAGNYSMVDKNPDNGRNLYRLKQEDINNVITYSKAVDVQFGDVLSRLHIFPNPATHTINLAIAQEGYYKGNYNISFVNSSGRVVKEVQSSQADWQGNITYLMPGTYLVRVVNTKTQSLVGENKFVKL